MNVSILAPGTWGTALAKTLVKHHKVMVWSYNEKDATLLTTTRRHPNLAHIVIPDEIEFSTDMKKCVEHADVIIVVTPSNFVRSTVEQFCDYINDEQIICCASKGIEAKSLYFMSDVIADVIKTNNPIVALSGPTHAEEVALDKLTLIVSASKNLEAAKTVQNLFVDTCIRPYTNDDIIGVELCGALKNIIALACGIAVGLGYGDNTKAAIMTRGLSEIKRLGIAMGCEEKTFAGLAGVGDLIVTATSMHSRNNRCGQYIGQGIPVKEAIDKVGMVVEGINALPAAIGLSKKYNIELPITKAVNNIINNSQTAGEEVKLLFSRTLKAEL